MLPLLVSDLPVFCRWRGEPSWGSVPLAEIVGLTDRLVVDSSEWRAVPKAYARLAQLFDSVAVSDIAFSRTLPWRRRLAELWPEIKTIEKLRVEGPRADAELVAGWLRSRLKREIALTRRDAPEVRAMWVDGEPVESPGELLSGSELLSAELDQFGRNAVYEAAVRAVVSAAPVTRHGDPSSSSAAAVRLARPDPNVVMRPLSVGVTLGRVADIDDDPARGRQRGSQTQRRRCHGWRSTSRTTTTGRRPGLA